jgi:hypothetical protein
MTAQPPYEQAHPLQVTPLLPQLQHDGVTHRVRTQWVTRRGWQPALISSPWHAARNPCGHPLLRRQDHPFGYEHRTEREHLHPYAAW